MNLTIPCPDVGCYTNFQCYSEFKGRVIAASIVDKNYSDQLDWTDKTALLESLFLLAVEGRAILFLRIAGEKPRPETAELAGSGMQISRPGAKTHTVNFTDAQVIGNTGFYNKILRTSQNYDFLYFTPGLIWDATGNMITLIGDPVIENDLTKFINGEVMVKWVSDDNPVESEFDTDTLLKGVYYLIDGETSIVKASGGGSAVEQYTAELNFDFGSTVLPDLVWSVSGETGVVEAVDAEMDPETGILTISGAVAGTYNLTVKVTNSAGCVFGTLDIVVTVTD